MRFRRDPFRKYLLSKGYKEIKSSTVFNRFIRTEDSSYVEYPKPKEMFLGTVSKSFWGYFYITNSRDYVGNIFVRNLEELKPYVD